MLTAAEVWRFRPKLALIPDWAVSTLFGLVAVGSIFIKPPRKVVLGICEKAEVDQMIGSRKTFYGTHSALPLPVPLHPCSLDRSNDVPEASSTNP